MATLYCIVLYLYIYIALLAAHTNQKRFQCERPREKKAVTRILSKSLSFIHSFITCICIAPLQSSRLLLRSAPDSTTAKKNSFKAGVECVRSSEPWGAIEVPMESHSK